MGGEMAADGWLKQQAMVAHRACPCQVRDTGEPSPAQTQQHGRQPQAVATQRTLSSSGVEACSRPAQCSACSCARLSCSPPSWRRSLPSGVCCAAAASAAASAASCACAAASWPRMDSSSAAAAVARCCAASAAACAAATACRASCSCAASCACCWLDRLAVSAAAASLAASFCCAASSSATSSSFSLCQGSSGKMKKKAMRASGTAGLHQTPGVVSFLPPPSPAPGRPHLPSLPASASPRTAQTCPGSGRPATSCGPPRRAPAPAQPPRTARPPRPPPPPRRAPRPARAAQPAWPPAARPGRRCQRAGRPPLRAGDGGVPQVSGVGRSAATWPASKPFRR